MSAKSGQSSELREVLARIQNAKANKANADRRLRRARTALDQAVADVAAAEGDLKDANGMLMGALRKGIPSMLKDQDLAYAIAETIANAADGGQSSGGAAPAPAQDAGGEAAGELFGRGSEPEAEEEQAPVRTSPRAVPDAGKAEVRQDPPASGGSASEDVAPSANAA